MGTGFRSWFAKRLATLCRAVLRSCRSYRIDSMTSCGKCGEPIIGEAPGTDPAQRKPCPKCGSTTRGFNDEIQETMAATDTVNATVITYPQNLLALCRMLIDEARFSIAVIVAHMACEIAT